jgi:hypothetical protein
MAKPETVPNPIQGLAHALETAAENSVEHVQSAQDAFNERFPEGPGCRCDGEEETTEALALAALPENLEAALDHFLGNAASAPGMEHARSNFPHLHDFPSLPTEILFSTAEI